MLRDVLESPDYGLLPDNNVIKCFYKYSNKCIFLVFAVFRFWAEAFNEFLQFLVLYNCNMTSQSSPLLRFCRLILPKAPRV